MAFFPLTADNANFTADTTLLTADATQYFVPDAGGGPDQTPRGGWGGGLPGLKISSLTRTRDLPGLRDMIEKDDERIVLAIADLIVKGTLH